MKKLILLVAVISSLNGLAQFTQTNEPVIGNGETLFVIDSAAVNYEGVTGSGVTWDYSFYGGYGSISRVVTVLDPAFTSNASDFSNSTQAIDIQNATTDYFSSTASQRVGQGYVFTEQTFGEVKLVFDTDEATLMNYPMNVGDIVTDTYQGTLYFSFSGLPQSPPASGSVTASVDGQGTLKLANGADFPNVLRYKLIDTASATLPLVGDVQVIRRQFEYYDHSSSTLPLFIHTYLSVTQSNGSVLAEISNVLSSVDPLEYVSIGEDESLTLQVYPNPAMNYLNIEANEVFDYTIFNASGVLVSTGNSSLLKTKLDISALNTGVYFVKIDMGSKVRIKKFNKL